MAKRGRKPKIPEEYSVDRKLLCAWTARTSRWITKMMKECNFPQPIAKSKSIDIWDVCEVFAWFHGFRDSKGDQTSTKEKLDQARYEHEQIKKELAELKLKVKREQLLDAGMVEARDVAKVLAVKNALSSMVEESGGLYGLTPQGLQDWLRKKCEQICNKFSGDYAVVEPEGDGGVEAEAASKPRTMGEPLPNCSEGACEGELEE